MADLHIRKQLRDAVTALLKGLPTAGQNVFPGRTRQTNDAMLPAILVYTRDETGVREAQGLNRHRCDLVVRCRVAESAKEPDDTLDAMALEVDRLLAGDSNEVLGNLIVDIVYVSTAMHASPMGDRRDGEADITYAVEYFAKPGDAGTAVVSR